MAEGERGSAWIELNWDTQVDVGKVVLYDRISCKNHVLGGVLSFSDGSEIRVGELNNMGGPTTIEFEPKTVDRIRFTIKSVSETTAEDGLAEIMVYEIDSDGFYCANNVKRGNYKKVVNNAAHEGEVDDDYFNNIEKTIRDDEDKGNKIKYYKNNEDEDKVDDIDDNIITTEEKNERKKYKNRNKIQKTFKKKKQKTFENNQENGKNNDEEVGENVEKINRPDNIRYTQDIKQDFDNNNDENKANKINEDKNEADDEDEEHEKKVVTENKIENEEEEEKEIAINADNDRKKEEDVLVGLTKTTENPTADKDTDEKDKLGKNSIFMINGTIILVIILIAVGFKSNLLRKSINNPIKKGF